VYIDGEKVEAVLAQQQPRSVDFIIGTLRSDSPEMFFYTWSQQGHAVHNPDYAMALYSRCQEVGMKCHLYGSPVSGLPQLKDGEQIIDVMARELGW
ncbi:MAG: hypothetical protein AAFR27_14245, partial [Pseudomonadota bacterium]